jgi:hypothetical protein
MPPLSRRTLFGAVSTSFLALASADKLSNGFDVLDYCNPMIGTADGGMLPSKTAMTN